MKPDYAQLYTFQKLSNSFEDQELGSFEELYTSEVWGFLRSTGLIVL